MKLFGVRIKFEFKTVLAMLFELVRNNSNNNDDDNDNDDDYYHYLKS